MPRRQQHLPGIKPGIGHIEIAIPVIPMWEQVGGDMSPGAYGAILAKSDGNAIELLEIQPVREHVGDEEAKEIGFPFWSKEAYFDLDDLDPKKDDVQSALNSIGMSFETLEDDYTPEQRAMVIAEALLGWGRGDEGTSGWSKDVVPDQVKWWGGDVAGPEYLADEDETFKDNVLGYSEIRTSIEEVVQRMADESNAMAWSTLGDQVLIDLEDAGYDPNTVVNIADFGDSVAVNGDLTDETVVAIMEKLEAKGYEETDQGGRIPSEEAEVSAEHVVSAVAEELDRSEEDVEKAAESLDWWQENIPWSSSGDGSIWAKRTGTETKEARRRARRR